MKNVLVREGLCEVKPSPAVQTKTTEKSQDAACLMFSVGPQSFSTNRNFEIVHTTPAENRVALRTSAPATVETDRFRPHIVAHSKRIIRDDAYADPERTSLLRSQRTGRRPQ